MRQSKFFAKIRRETPKDEVSINAKLLIRAGFVDKLMAGVYTFLPLGLLVLKKIENIIREEMTELGGQEILMPTLQPKTNWEKTGRWNAYDSLFKFTSPLSKTEYALGPTHEEIVVPLAQKFNLSYKDLPVAVFQIQNKFRDEARAKSGLLRGREFLMKDLYSFHKNEDDLDAYYEKVKESYVKIFKRVGIGEKTFLTFASGGTFSKYSHEFQTLTEAGEDNIHLCEKCSIAINAEIINEQKTCPSCGNLELKREKGVEVGNIFKLKTKYSSPFGLKFKDETGKEHDLIMGCYGIGLARLMGTIIEIFHDENGIIWPESVAPFKIHLILINSENIEIKKQADKIYTKLKNELKMEVLYDDRENVSPGEKFMESDIIGIPWRLVISEKTAKEGKIEVKKRCENKTELVKIEEFIKSLKN